MYFATSINVNNSSILNRDGEKVEARKREGENLRNFQLESGERGRGRAK